MVRRLPRVPIAATESYEARRNGLPLQHPKDVPWRLAELAHGTYASLFGGRSAQSLERLIERGSLSWTEFACLLAGHYPSVAPEHAKCRIAALAAVEQDAVEVAVQAERQRCARWAERVGCHLRREVPEESNLLDVLDAHVRAIREGRDLP